jgi:hypothetical protein
VARLTSNHDDLATMMPFMRDEVGQHMPDVEGQVAPDIPLRRRNLAPRRKTQLEQRFDPFAAPVQRCNELPACDTTVIDASRRGNPVFAAERLDPHASRVVEVSRDRADRTLGSGHRNVPQGGGEPLDQVDRDPVVGPPGFNQGRVRRLDDQAPT